MPAHYGPSFYPIAITAIKNRHADLYQAYQSNSNHSSNNNHHILHLKATTTSTTASNIQPFNENIPSLLLDIEVAGSDEANMIPEYLRLDQKKQLNYLAVQLLTQFIMNNNDSNASLSTLLVELVRMELLTTYLSKGYLLFKYAK